MPNALFDTGEQTVTGADLVLRGLPPMACERALRETVGRMRSKPVAAT